MNKRNNIDNESHSYLEWRTGLDEVRENGNGLGAAEGRGPSTNSMVLIGKCGAKSGV